MCRRHRRHRVHHFRLHRARYLNHLHPAIDRSHRHREGHPHHHSHLFGRHLGRPINCRFHWCRKECRLGVSRQFRDSCRRHRRDSLFRKTSLLLRPSFPLNQPTKAYRILKKPFEQFHRTTFFRPLQRDQNYLVNVARVYEPLCQRSGCWVYGR